MGGRERFIPRRVGQLTDELAAPDADGGTDAEGFRALGRLVSAHLHFEFHDRAQTLIDTWQDAEAGDVAAAAAFRGQLDQLLCEANYVEVSMEELQEAIDRESLIPLRLEVDLDDYDDVLVYRRGGRSKVVEVRRWRGLRRAERTITVDDRVVVLTRIKSQTWFDERGIKPAARNLEPGRQSLKQFQRMPRADIEMLLPSARVRYRPVDTFVMGLPAVASAIAVLVTKLLPTLGLMFVLVGAWLGFREEEPKLDQAALVVLFGGVVTIGGFVVRQWSKLENRRVNYLKTLSETLYFRALADGPGVVHTLLSAAEQQETAEVMLAYRMLAYRMLPTTPDGLTTAELDRAVERWLQEHCHHGIDFDVANAVANLRTLDLVTGDDVLQARPVDDALVRLDRRWSDLFRYGEAATDPLAPVTGR
jgi:hypothetical protein